MIQGEAAVSAPIRLVFRHLKRELCKAYSTCHVSLDAVIDGLERSVSVVCEPGLDLSTDAAMRCISPSGFRFQERYATQCDHQSPTV